MRLCSFRKASDQRKNMDLLSVDTGPRIYDESTTHKRNKTPSHPVPSCPVYLVTNSQARTQLLRSHSATVPWHVSTIKQDSTSTLVISSSGRGQIKRRIYPTAQSIRIRTLIGHCLFFSHPQKTAGITHQNACLTPRSKRCEDLRFTIDAE
ncbi:hypothetical protein BDD12DRAFT_282087 [Trichophaea hybrida]|nr:hypothetical protein BDD12DRAFT_282087 [Trichophaea hybrida]